jgi:hypothetical protein
MSRIRPQDVINVKDVIVVLVVVPIVEDALVGLGEDSTRVVGELVAEGRIALGVGESEVGREGFEWLTKRTQAWNASAKATSSSEKGDCASRGKEEETYANGVWLSCRARC